MITTLLSRCYRVLLILAVSLVLNACGGGGGGTSTEPGSGNDFSTRIGVFTDSPVMGLTYSFESKLSKTNAEGKFEYRWNDTLGDVAEKTNFYLGGLFLGQVSGKQNVTPLDIFGATSTDDPRVVNLLRLLQTLDNDDNPDNGIEIPPSAQEQFTEGLITNWANDIFSNNSPIITILDTVKPGASIVSAENAVAHFIAQISELPEIELFSVGGNSSGLIGNVELEINGDNSITVSPSDSAFIFGSRFISGAPYSVTIKTTSASQTCVLQNQTGAISNSDINGVSLSCTEIVTTEEYQVGGSVSNLNGSLSIRNNTTSEDLTITTNGAFSFNTLQLTDSFYNVSIVENPAKQTCVFTPLSSAEGQVLEQDIATITISCKDNVVRRYMVSGSINGLSNEQSVSLSLNGGQATIFTGNAFSFPEGLLDDESYAVSVTSKPSYYTCLTENAQGVIDAADISLIEVNCSHDVYNIGGQVTGHQGLVSISLSENGTTTKQTAVATSDASFVFEDVLDGTEYAISAVIDANTGQTCQVANASATLAGSHIVNANVVCSDIPSYGIGGNVEGLSGTLVLRNNSVDNLTITNNGSFEFGAKLEEGQSYAVEIVSQPASQDCSITSGSESGNVQNIAINSIAISCSDKSFNVQAAVTGHSSNLSLVLIVDGQAQPAVTLATQEATYDFGQFAYNSSINITATAPEGQTCQITNGSSQGLMADLTASITCTDVITHSVSTTVSGLPENETLNVVINGLSAQRLNGTMSQTLVDGDTLVISVSSFPEGYSCPVSEFTSPVSTDQSVTIVCSQNTYEVSGTVVGLQTSDQVSILFSDQSAQTYSASNNTFSFTLAHGSSFALSSDDSLKYDCGIDGGDISSVTSAVSNVVVTCDTVLFSVSGRIEGLMSFAGISVTLNRGSQTHVESATSLGNFTFTELVNKNETISLSIANVPEGYSCLPPLISDPVTSNVTNYVIQCAANKYSVSVDLRGIGNYGRVGIEAQGAISVLVSDGVVAILNTDFTNTPISFSIDSAETNRQCLFSNGSTEISTSVTGNTTVIINCQQPNIFTDSISLTVPRDPSIVSEIDSWITQDASMIARVNQYILANGVDDLLEVGSIDLGCIAYRATKNSVYQMIQSSLGQYAYDDGSFIASDIQSSCENNPYRVSGDFTIDESINNYYDNLVQADIIASRTTNQYFFANQSGIGGGQFEVLNQYIDCQMIDENALQHTFNSNDGVFSISQTLLGELANNNNNVVLKGSCALKDNHAMTLVAPSTLAKQASSIFSVQINGFASSGYQYTWTSSCLGFNGSSTSSIASPEWTAPNNGFSCSISLVITESVTHYRHVLGTTFFIAEPPVYDTYQGNNAELTSISEINTFVTKMEDEQGYNDGWDAISAAGRIYVGCIKYSSDRDIIYGYIQANLPAFQDSQIVNECTIDNPVFVSFDLSLTSEADLYTNAQAEWLSYTSPQNGGDGSVSAVLASLPSFLQCSSNSSLDALTNQTVDASFSGTLSASDNSRTVSLVCDLRAGYTIGISSSVQVFGNSDHVLSLDVLGFEQSSWGYTWTSTCGSFNDTTSSAPTWNAPNNVTACDIGVSIIGEDLAYSISTQVNLTPVFDDYKGDLINYSSISDINNFILRMENELGFDNGWSILAELGNVYVGCIEYSALKDEIYNHLLVGLNEFGMVAEDFVNECVIDNPVFISFNIGLTSAAQNYTSPSVVSLQYALKQPGGGGEVSAVLASLPGYLECYSAAYGAKKIQGDTVFASFNGSSVTYDDNQRTADITCDVKTNHSLSLITFGNEFSGGTKTLGISISGFDSSLFNYLWSSDCGSFDNAAVRSPIWTKPEEAQSCQISVQVNDGNGFFYSSSFNTNIMPSFDSFESSVNDYASISEIDLYVQTMEDNYGYANGWQAFSDLGSIAIGCIRYSAVRDEVYTHVLANVSEFGLTESEIENNCTIDNPYRVSISLNLLSGWGFDLPISWDTLDRSGTFDYGNYHVIENYSDAWDDRLRVDVTTLQSLILASGYTFDCTASSGSFDETTGQITYDFIPHGTLRSYTTIPLDINCTTNIPEPSFSISDTTSALPGSVISIISDSWPFAGALGYRWEEKCNAAYETITGEVGQSFNWTLSLADSCSVKSVAEYEPQNNGNKLVHEREYQVDIQSPIQSNQLLVSPAVLVPGQFTNLSVDVNSDAINALNYIWSATCSSGQSGFFSIENNNQATWIAPSVSAGVDVCAIVVSITDSTNNTANFVTSVQISNDFIFNVRNGDNPRELLFEWTSTANVTRYQLYQSVGLDSFGMLLVDISDSYNSFAVELSLTEMDVLGDRFSIRALNDAGDIIDSFEGVTLSNDALDQAIGFFKSGLPSEGESFGLFTSLAADNRGDLLAVSSNDGVKIYAISNRTITNNGWYLAQHVYPGTQVSRAVFSKNGDVLLVWRSNGNEVDLFSLSNEREWTYLQGLVGDNTESGDGFGSSLSVSDDGAVIAIGAQFEDGNSTNSRLDSGAAYVFEKDTLSSSWLQTAYLTNIYPTGYTGDYFGTAVTVSGTGRYIAVGATEVGDFGYGSVSLFDKFPGQNTWWDSNYFRASNRDSSDYFGSFVALDYDGDTLAVGSPNEDGGTSGVNGDSADNSTENSGAVYIFNSVNESWAQTNYIKSSNPESGDDFGRKFALSSDGVTLAVSASREDSNASGLSGSQFSNGASDAGAVYVFKNSNEWSQTAYVKSKNTSSTDYFGTSISISEDGSIIAIGAPNEDSSSSGVDSSPNDLLSNSGAVYLY